MGAYNIVSAASMAAGQPEDVSPILANFQAIAAVLNGGLDNSNINVAAAIALSKLAGYPSDGTKFPAGDGTWKTVGVSVATTVAGLGTAADGKMGLLRVGATPFELVSVIYDATYGKWVSPEVLIFDLGTNTLSFNAIGEGDLGAKGMHKYRAFQAAGLVPYFRTTAQIGKSSGGANSDMTIGMQMATSDEGANEAATGAYTATFGAILKTITGTNIVAYDTGWVTPGALPTVGDHLFLKLRANTSNTTDAKIWATIKTSLRWAA